jgi:hypothetical protein
MLKNSVPITLDKERVLHFDFNALTLVEEALGINLREDNDLQMTLRDTRAFLWAGLRRNDPALTLEQTGDLIDEFGLPEIMPKLNEAWFLYRPKSEPEEGETESPLAETPQLG